MQPGSAAAVDGLPLVGTGPVAVVRALRRPGLGGSLAIKVFPEPMDRYTRGGLDRERAALRRIRDLSSVLQVDDVQELPDGRPALYMELCEQSLDRLLATHGTLTFTDAMAIGQALAVALEAAHAVGVVHGAVTPHNVLLRADGEPVLADFGMALRRRYPQDPAHAVGWTAPETVRDAVVDERTDLYGLGAVVFTALTGRPPFAGPSSNRASHAALHRDDVPEQLRDLLTALLAEDPAQRPPDATAALTALTALLDDDHGQPADEQSEPLRPTGFDDFPGRADRVSGDHVGDDFFAEWSGTPVAEPAAARAEQLGLADDAAFAAFVSGAQPLTEQAPAEQPGPVEPWHADAEPVARQRRSRGRLGRTIGVAAGFAVLVAVPVLSGRHPSAPTGQSRTEAVAPVPVSGGATRRHKFDLAQPQDLGNQVSLSWSSDLDLKYAVVVAGTSLRTQVVVVDRQHSAQVSVDPVTQYCFQVQGLDGGGQVYLTAPRGIRGAICKQ